MWWQVIVYSVLVIEKYSYFYKPVVIYQVVFLRVSVGSGKTAAFLVPILSQIYNNGPQLSRPPPQQGSRFKQDRQFPIALILAPTRELASQIHDEARKVCLCLRHFTHLRLDSLLKE